MRLAHPPRFWFLTALATLAACFGLTAFHAEEDPNDQFVYDRTESVLHLSLEAPGGTVFYSDSPPVAVGVLLDRYSWEIWRQPSTGMEEYRNASTSPESGAAISLTGSLQSGSLAQSELTTGSDGRAWTTYSPNGSWGGVSIQASSGESNATLNFDISYSPDPSQWTEQWTYSHTEATLIATFDNVSATVDLLPGGTRDLSLTVRYETWIVETSNFGNSRIVNFTSAPAANAGVTWSIETGDGHVSGYGTTDSVGMAQASFTMGSGESVVRADISYAAGQATSTSLAFSPQTGGGGAESGGPSPGEGGSPSTWTQIGTETIPVIVNLSADGSTELSSGETRQFNGQLQAEVWDIWTDGSVEHRSFNYVTYLPGTSLTAEIVQGDGWLGTTSLTTDGSGWFSSSYTMGSTPAQIALRIDGQANPSATIGFSVATNTNGGTGNTGGGGTGSGGDDWSYLYTDSAYGIWDLVVNGPTYNLPAGEVRSISGTLYWSQWEIWGHPTSGTEARNGLASPVPGATVNASVLNGDGTLSSLSLPTGSMGEFSADFTMGSEDSTVQLSLDGPQPVSITLGFTGPPVPEQWTKLRDESSVVASLSVAPGIDTPVPGQSIPLLAAVTVTTWEVRQSSLTGEIREFNHQTGPAIGAPVAFTHLSGPGSLASLQAETDVDGIATVNFTVGESEAGIRATAGFQTATSEAQIIVSPGIWVMESSHEELDLSLSVLGNPATSIEATVLHRTWQTWRNTTSGATEVRHQSLAPAANAELVFVRLDGGTPVFGSSPLFTNVSGLATTTYQSDAALNVSVTAGFAGLTTTSTLALPQGWGVVGGGTGGGGTGGGGTGGGGTGGGGTGGGGTGGGGTSGGGTSGGGTGGGQNPPNIKFTLQGHGLEYRGASDGGDELGETDEWEYGIAEGEEQKATMEMEGWEEYGGSSPAPDRPTIYQMRRWVGPNGGTDEIEDEDPDKDDFRAILVGEAHDPEKRRTIEGNAKVKKRIEDNDPYTATPTMEPDPWTTEKRSNADPEEAIHIAANSFRPGGENSYPAIFPQGVFKTHIWLAADVPVEVETKRSFPVVLVETSAGSTSEPVTTPLGKVVFTLEVGDRVSTEAEYEGDYDHLVSVVGGADGCVQLTAETPSGAGSAVVKVLAAELKAIYFGGDNLGTGEFTPIKSDGYPTPREELRGIWIDKNGDLNPSNHHIGEKNQSVAYIRATTPKMGVVVRVEDQPDNAVIKIRGKGSDGIEIPETTAVKATSNDAEAYQAGESRYFIPFTDSVKAWPNQVRFYERDHAQKAFKMTWEIKISNDAWAPIGETKHQVYITLGAPLAPVQATWCETLFHLGCSNAAGLDAPDAVRSAVYATFEGRNVKRVDGTQMTYWKNDEQGESNAVGILASENGNGNCNAWSDIFNYALLLQGIPSRSVRATPPAGENGILMVKKWAFIGDGSGTGEYPFIEAPEEEIVEIIDVDEDDLPAQGNDSPPGAFKFHMISESGGHYYDPSYGTPVSTTPEEHEIGAFDGFKVKIDDQENRFHYRAKRNAPGLDAIYE